MIDGLRLVIRTPQGIVFDRLVRSARLPTETGQAGLRPREEPILLAVEPGLVLLSVDRILHFAATAGGLLEGDREGAVIYTPFAVVGDNADDVLSALEEAVAVPGSELAARRRLAELEERIAQELRQGPPGARVREVHG